MLLPTSGRRAIDILLIITVVDERANVIITIGCAVDIIAVVGSWFQRWLIRWIVDINCLCISTSDFELKRELRVQNRRLHR